MDEVVICDADEAVVGALDTGGTDIGRVFCNVVLDCVKLVALAVAVSVMLVCVFMEELGLADTT